MARATIEAMRVRVKRTVWLILTALSDTMVVRVDGGNVARWSQDSRGVLQGETRVAR